MFSYLNDNVLSKELREDCENILLQVQKRLIDYFSFDFRIFGSGENRLLLRQGNTNNFSMDYSIILQKDKKGLFGTPNEVMKLFKNAFSGLFPEVVFQYLGNSETIIQAKFLDFESEYSYSLNISFLMERVNKNYLRLVYYNQFDSYVWKEIKNSKNYQNRFKMVKDEGIWTKFKEEYLIHKNEEVLSNNLQVSFNTFLKVLNKLKGTDDEK